jgi:hypothetical protein
LVSKHADRVETIFVEVEKKFYDFDKFNDVVKEMDRSFKKITGDFDKLRITVEEKADKKEFVKLVDKFSDFEKHTSNILKLLDQKSRNTVDELNSLFNDLKQELEKKNDIKINIKGLTSGTAIDTKTDVKTDAKTEAKIDAAPDTTSKKDSVSAEGPKDGASLTPVAEAGTDASSAKSESKPEVKMGKNGMFGFLKK